MTTHDLVYKYLYDCIYSSVKVEGLGMTYPQTLRILKGGELNGVTVSDVFFVVNMKRAWKFLEDNKEYPVNVMLLREYNKICGEGLIADCGNLRLSPVIITGTSYVPPIPELHSVASILSEINSISDPFDRAVEMFMFISKAQIFMDGNKRVAQLVANHVLVSSDAGILKIPDTSVPQFTDALIKHYEGDSTSLREYLLEECVIRSYVSEYVEYNNDRFSVDEICNALPKSVVEKYSSKLECAKDNVDKYYRMLL